MVSITDGGSGVAASSKVPQSSGIKFVSSIFIGFLACRCLARSKLFDEVFRGGIGENVESWRDYQFVLIEWSDRLDYVDRLADGPQWPVVADEFVDGAIALVVALPIDGPTAVVRVQNRDFRFD